MRHVTQIRRVVAAMPPKEARQTLLFSATFPRAIQVRCSKGGVLTPVRVAPLILFSRTTPRAIQVHSSTHAHALHTQCTRARMHGTCTARARHVNRPKDRASETR